MKCSLMEMSSPDPRLLQGNLRGASSMEASQLTGETSIIFLQVGVSTPMAHVPHLSFHVNMLLECRLHLLSFVRAQCQRRDGLIRKVPSLFIQD